MVNFDEANRATVETRSCRKALNVFASNYKHAIGANMSPAPVVVLPLPCPRPVRVGSTPFPVTSDSHISVIGRILALILDDGFTMSLSVFPIAGLAVTLKTIRFTACLCKLGHQLQDVAALTDFHVTSLVIYSAQGCSNALPSRLDAR